MMIFMMKKRPHPRFNVPNQGTINRSRVKDRWRKQRGIDSKKRWKKSFAGSVPTIGYRNPESLRYTKANGKRVFVVNNINELKEFIGNPEMANYDATIASTVSRKKRMPMIKLAKENNVRITNDGAT